MSIRDMLETIAGAWLFASILLAPAVGAWLREKFREDR